MDEDTATFPQRHTTRTSEQQLVTSIVHAPDDSTVSQSPKTNTESPEQDERVIFLNVMEKGDGMSIDQIKSSMITSFREGITWVQRRFHRRTEATDMEIFCTLNGSTRPNGLINDLEQIGDVYMVKPLLLLVVSANHSKTLTNEHPRIHQPHLTLFDKVSQSTLATRECHGTNHRI